MPKRIINKTRSCQTIPWAELKGYEFNTLKQAEGRDVSKLKNAIVNDGFIFPLFIWAGHHFVIDGAGRDKALLELEAEGYEIDDIPVVEIQADNKRQAKMLTLQASSRFGEITKESYEDFIFDMGLTDGDLGKFDLNIDLSSDLNLAAELPDLDESVDQKIKQITFYFSLEQFATVERAVEASKRLGDLFDAENDNVNGNAMARVCEIFLGLPDVG
jgi:hypothetical protein